MGQLDAKQLTGWLKAKVEGDLPPHPIRHLATDTRRLSDPSHCLFVALRGPNHDGHTYLADAARAGVPLALVADDDQTAQPKGMTFLRVADPLAALQSLTGQHRDQFDIPVVGITGSNGKTIVKEWLAGLLSPDRSVVRSPKSYNSQVGVPLSLWQIADHHQVALIEAGISEPGEMAKLAEIIQPTVGVFTTLGPAHQENFKSLEHKLAEKLNLFSGVQTLVYRRDREAIHQGIATHLPGVKTLSWGQHSESDIYVAGVDSLWSISEAGEKTKIELPFSDSASVENALHAAVAARVLGLSWSVIAERLRGLRPISMRLQLKTGRRSLQLVDDSYNNDLVGLTLALDFLATQTARKERVVILSDLLQDGRPAAELYPEVGAQLVAHGVTQVLTIGPETGKAAQAWGLPVQCFETTEDLLTSGAVAELREAAVLVKGARRFRLERVVEALEAQRHLTVLELNLDAFANNLSHYRRLVGPKVQILAMVKAFAYGSGAQEVAHLLQFARADWLGVAYLDEGIALREAGIQLPIMVLNPDPERLAECIHYRLEPTIFSERLLTAWLRCAPKGERPPLHLEFDTGMSRLGFSPEAAGRVAHQLKDTAPHEVRGVFSHLAVSGDPKQDDFTRGQIKAFGQIADLLEAELSHPLLKHLANSSGITRFPQAHFDMVRLGIGLYGIGTDASEHAQLERAGLLRTTLSQLRDLKPGDTVSYDRTFTAVKPMRIATLPIGYGDGYSRRFSNGVGEVIVAGRACPVVGRVCMDMCMVDVTGLEVQEGDSAIVLGPGMDWAEAARRIGTISYELLTSLGPRLPRVYYRES